MLRISRTLLGSFLCVLPLVAAGCDRTTQPETSELRVRNVGSVPLSALLVGFPEATVTFGDVPSGASSEYQRIPGGVYRYAFYGFRYADSALGQPVIDFMGETPLPGHRFTYDLALTRRADGRPWIELIAVTRDR